jgi:hypothetical protein
MNILLNQTSAFSPSECHRAWTTFGGRVYAFFASARYSIHVGAFRARMAFTATLL